MIAFLHDPTISKYEFAVAGAGLVGLCYVIATVVRDKKPDPYRLRVLREEVFADDDGEEIVVVGELPNLVVGKKYPLWTRTRLTISFICILVMISGALLGARGKIILACLSQAGLMSRLSRFDLAEHYCRMAIRIDGAVIQSHRQLADILTKEGKEEQAIPELRLVVSVDNNDVGAYISLGDALMAVGRPVEAEPAFRQAIAIMPHSATPYVKVGICLLRLKRLHDAEQEFDYAHTQDPNDAKALVYLGSMLFDAGHKAEGIAHIKRATQLAPADITAHNTLAMAYIRTGRTADAVPEFRTELSIDPEFAVGYYNLGRALKQLNDKAGAKDAYETYLRKCKQNPGTSMIGMKSAQKDLESINISMFGAKP